MRAHPGLVSAATLDTCRIGHVTRLRFDYATGSATEASELGRAFGPSAMEVTLEVLGNSKLDLGFELLVGIPGQTVRSAVSSVESVLKHGATSVHLGIYELSGSCALAKERAEHDEAWLDHPAHRLPATEQRAEMVTAMADKLRAEGFAEYLPGEWALPGHEYRFLQMYAQGIDVLGFGLGARTRFDGVGASNTDDLSTYLRFSDDPARCIVNRHLLREVGPVA